MVTAGALAMKSNAQAKLLFHIVKKRWRGVQGMASAIYIMPFLKLRHQISGINTAESTGSQKGEVIWQPNMYNNLNNHDKKNKIQHGRSL